MLVALSIRDVVVIHQLDLAFHDGLCVLTGETGTGKSILLDALGLALGARGDAALVRAGANQATVIAEFEMPALNPARTLVCENGLGEDDDGGRLILRRTLGTDGRSRAFVNDRPVSVSLLRELGDAMVEVEGQFARHGLNDPSAHLEALDDFAGVGPQCRDAALAHQAWRDAEIAHDEAKASLARTRADEDYLRYVAAELEALDPKPAEDTALADERTLLRHGEQLIEATATAATALTDGEGVESNLKAAIAILERNTNKAGGRLDQSIAALDRASAEAAEAISLLQRFIENLSPDPNRLEAVEERLFALRAVARKHGVEVDALPGLCERFKADLAWIEQSGADLTRLAADAKTTRAAYIAAAESLSTARSKAAAAFDRAIAAELPPLKLEKATFRTGIARIEEASWRAEGFDRVEFEVTTNPGTPPGPLARIASGGELARFMLVLKVVLAKASAIPTLVFDEVDAGVGGATAAAVGERLARLAENVQVLVVTHSPQVAARGAHHWRVIKEQTGARDSGAVALIDELSAEDRREEIARMLSGAKITDAARAAADSLIAGHRV